MGKIAVLESLLAGRIAAGEVVERPASVVKELVENALDAGAGSIEVEIERGGFDLVRVRDDGEGMDREDAHLALLRFATSKVRSPEDLGRIITLGFRGEALPSIAAVSHLELVTSTGEGEGTRVRAEGGRIVSSDPVGAPRGTTVSVRRLFYNTPARRKFLKGTAREAALCLEVVEKYAVGWPEVRFRVVRDGKEVFTLPPASRGERAGRILGVEAARLIEVKARDDQVALDGFVGPPEAAVESRQGQHFFVNRRPVRSPMLSRAVEEGMSTLVFTDHHPVCALFLDLPADLVDPNVHPRKLEVRFANERHLFNTVAEAVQEAMRSRQLLREVPPGGYPSRFPPYPPPSLSPVFDPTRVVMSSREHSQVEVRTGKLPPLRVLGQVANTYIVAASSEGLVLVDQHAAHERVLYERLTRLKGKSDYVQILVVPASIDLTPSEVEIAERMEEALREAGFVLSGFGGTTCLVRAIPSIAARAPLVPLVRACLRELVESDTVREPAVLARRLTSIAACHSAVKAGDPLQAEEMIALLKDLGDCEDPYTCFHGRPTLIVVNPSKLQEWFLRT